MEDRRVFTRISLKSTLRFLNLNTGKEGAAETVDISANGVGFITKERLSAKTPLDMWLYVPEHNKPFYTRGYVVWSQVAVDATCQRVGVCLENVDLMGLARALWDKEDA